MTAHRSFKLAVRSARRFRSVRRFRSRQEASPHWMMMLPDGVGKWMKWMTPGMSMKRWMLISAGGVLMISLGFAIWVKLTPIFYITQLFSDLLEYIARTVPNYISGPVVILTGLALVWLGQTRTFNSITQVLIPDHDQRLVDMIWDHRRLNRGPRIVVIGGGTGLSTLLRGLKLLSTNLVAIVTVADDGGSSGRLRREIGVLPPGDIRNCLAALADEEKLITELFQYRFQAGDGLVGHSASGPNLKMVAGLRVNLKFPKHGAKSSKSAVLLPIPPHCPRPSKPFVMRISLSSDRAVFTPALCLICWFLKFVKRSLPPEFPVSMSPML